MPRYLITIEYIGTNYQGSQKQPDRMPETQAPVKTIQGELEKAISTLTKTKTKTIFSGRTDAGVHAKGQTAHFDTGCRLDALTGAKGQTAHFDTGCRLDALTGAKGQTAHFNTGCRLDALTGAKGQTAHFDSGCGFTGLACEEGHRACSDTEPEIDTGRFINSLNAILPNDISVKELKKVPERFHAQKSAKARHYRYVIANRRQRSAWDYNCLLVKYPLNIERINKALSYLKGEHDFTSFKKVKTSNPAKICRMYKAEAVKDGDYVYIDFTADRFLYNMIRTITGTLLMIERKNLPAEVMKEILDSRDRTKAGSVISPDGLTLMEVIYNNIDGEIK